MNQSRVLPAVPRPTTVARLAAACGLDVIGDSTVTVTSAGLDNRLTIAGDLFAALPGAHVHGAQFAAAAVAAGACAILTDPAGAARLTDLAPVPILVAADPRAILGRVAAFIHGNPAAQMRTFAVTGTNGKTTTTFLLDDLNRRLGNRTGLVGTVESRYADTVVPSRLTTPEAPELQGWLAAMVADDVAALAMEVSSHALSLGRVDGLTFDIAGFTNLSQDHLDFHHSFDEYFEAKATLFTPERADRGVLMVDDVWGRRLAGVASIPVVTVSATGLDADWTVTDALPDTDGTSFTLRARDGRWLRTRVDLPGSFNVANAALALVMRVEAGTSLDLLGEALGTDGLNAQVPGRMEVISQAPRVIVDFAHNADALGLVLGSLRPTTPGRLTVVFGATGERDTTKRPIMGAVAARGADVVIVTDDDPHGEPAAQIRAAVFDGARAEAASMTAAAKTHSGGGEPDGGAAALTTNRALGRTPEILDVAPRAQAIRQAILTAGAADTIVIAGRGHETIQEVNGVDLPLDDRVEARAALAARLT